MLFGMRTMTTYCLTGGDTHDTADLTARLCITPTDAFDGGDNFGRVHPIVRSHALWELSSSSGPEDGVELADQFRRVLALLEPRRELLWELVDKDGWRADWFCYLGSHATEHAAELDRDTLNRLLRLPGEIFLDVYEDGPEDCP